MTLIRNLIFENATLDTQCILNILCLLGLVLEQNFCQFDHEFFAQPSGLSMGNNLSPLLSEIFMSNLESEIFNSHFAGNLLYWGRYVDDVGAIFNGDEDTFNSFVAFINGLHPNIIFTHELEENNILNFLDLSIKRTPNKFEYSIYRKNTTTDMVIPFDSNSPLIHKKAAFHSFLHRCFSIPMNQSNFERELSIIKHIALNNGYPTTMINNMISEYSWKFSNLPIYKANKSEPENRKFVCLPYVNSTSIKKPRF